MPTGIRIRTSTHDGITTVRSIMRHPMETGFDKDPGTGLLKPPHFIKEVTCRHEDTVVMSCEWSRAVSRNPYLSFEFEGARAGDNLTISWRDNLGQTDSTTVVIE